MRALSQWSSQRPLREAQQLGKNKLWGYLKESVPLQNLGLPIVAGDKFSQILYFCWWTGLRRKIQPSSCAFTSVTLDGLGQHDLVPGEDLWGELWKSLELPQLDGLQHSGLWSSPQLGTRSEEILGLPMGQPATRWADIFKFLRGVVFIVPQLLGIHR
jgi:hypothetical protein